MARWPGIFADRIKIPVMLGNVESTAAFPAILRGGLHKEASKKF
jgi:hypothetical protein